MVMWITLIAYICIMVGIGIYCKKKTGSVSDFVLGGRSLGPWMTAFCVRHVVFLCGGVYRLRRSIWLELWYCGNLDRHWKRNHRQYAGMDAIGQPHTHYDKTAECFHHAGIL